VRRARAVEVAVVVAAAILVFGAAAELPLPARSWTAFLLAVLPAIAVAQVRGIGDPADYPRLALYVSSAVALWVIAGITGIVARVSAIDARVLGLVALPVAPLLLWSAGTVIAGLTLIMIARMAGIEESPMLVHLLPVTVRERLAFVGVSATAGFCEELVFRGFLIATLGAATGSTPLAILLSSGAFGLLHAYQRPSGAVRAAALGALLAAPLVATGSIVPAIIVHAVLDLIGGLVLRER
jgi:membrane protease YdiL (CAAX protease family)